MIALPRAPATLAGALALAIADGRATLAREDAVDRFEGTEWHRPKPAGADTPPTCAVSAPSSVMAGTLKVEPTTWVSPRQFDPPWQRALEAIDALRRGNWDAAWDGMHPRARLERLGAVFAKRMVKRLCSKSISRHKLREVADFKGLEEYNGWLRLVEDKVLPIVDAEEQAHLDVIAPGHVNKDRSVRRRTARFAGPGGTPGPVDGGPSAQRERG